MSSSTTFVYISNDPKFIIEKKFPKKVKQRTGTPEVGGDAGA
jgi:hypothetical protein